jgi:hypothetical protein
LALVVRGLRAMGSRFAYQIFGQVVIWASEQGHIYSTARGDIEEKSREQQLKLFQSDTKVQNPQAF